VYDGRNQLPSVVIGVNGEALRCHIHQMRLRRLAGSVLPLIAHIENSIGRLGMSRCDVCASGLAAQASLSPQFFSFVAASALWSSWDPIRLPVSNDRISL
jgi:hypothetical protein